MAEEEIVEREEQEQEEQEQEAAEEQITLSKEEYKDLISRISKAETLATSAAARMDTPSEDEPEEVDPSDEEIKGMTPSAFYKKVKESVDRSVAAPLIRAVNTLDTRIQIIETRARYKEFDDYYEETKAIAISNPQMRVEDAFLLAKQRNPKPLKKTPSEPPAPKPKPKPPLGERPNAHPQGMKSGDAKMTVREAAMKAAEKIGSGE